MHYKANQERQKTDAIADAVEIRRLQEIAPIKAMYYDVDGVFYYKDGWFLYTWNGFDWDIISMDTDTSNLYELWENESDQ